MKEYIIIIGIISIIIVIGSYILNRRGDTGEEERTSQYECGEEVFSEETTMYTIKYYKIALTYLVFDIETILIFPSSMLINRTIISDSTIYIFIGLLLIGLYYEYYNNIFD